MSLHFAEKAAGAIGPLRVVAEKVTVLLHGGTAASGVDNDGVDVGGFEEGDEVASHGGGLVFESGVDHQGSAAGLAGWDNDFETFSGSARVPWRR